MPRFPEVGTPRFLAHLWVATILTQLGVFLLVVVPSDSPPVLVAGYAAGLTGFVFGMILLARAISHGIRSQR